MEQNETKKRIISLLADILEVEESEIREETHLVKELGADSMAALEILANVEKIFGFTLNPELLPRMTSVNEILKVVKENLKNDDVK